MDNKASPVPVTFQFRNIGPAKNADLTLGNLTVIAGRNNTGKTYIAYTLYGFLRMWPGWPGAEGVFGLEERPPHGSSTSAVNILDLHTVYQQLRRDGVASFPVNSELIHNQRRALLASLSQDFSTQAISQVFSSPPEEFIDASITAVYEDQASSPIGLTSASHASGQRRGFSMNYDAGQLTIRLNEARSRTAHDILDIQLAHGYLTFLLGDVLPQPFILSAERFGISLFYRELDFTKNHLVDMLQKLGDDKNRASIDPFFLLDRTTSRYALPIKDNIDYTRSIPDLRRTKTTLEHDKLFDQIKDMMGGYYRTVDGEIRFQSRARKGSTRFQIPLHLASSSARGLSDLYFFLRHVAKPNHLLIIDEPESHLDTVNQIALARMLARFVRAGLRVLITTHSDYVLKELNNLIMLTQEFEAKDTVVTKLGYDPAEALDPVSIRAYVAENGQLTPCEIDEFGIDMPLFDDTIDSINRASVELASHIRRDPES